MTQPNGIENDFYDSATSEFPAKEDLKDRLVAIWFTGKTGMRKSEQPGGQPYPYCESVTVVLDDGPKGWSEVRADGDPNLVPAVADNGPQRLDDFQWSAKGIHARVSKRQVGGKPMIGRINSMKNKTKGFNDAWSIAEMTPEDVEIAREHRDFLIATTNELAAAHQKAADDEAFTS